MEQATFTTARLTIRPRTLADTDACLAMDDEPAVTRFVDGPWDDPVAHRKFIEERTLGPYPPGLGYWTILDWHDRFVGWVMLIPLDTRGPEIEIGWRLKPASWGKGYATEAVRALVLHGLEDLGLPEIVADIDVRNSASRRVAEKAGLCSRGTILHHGRESVRYALRREELAAARV
jgi:RimJ/RimL family protein N-acetyltransferase